MSHIRLGLWRSYLCSGAIAAMLTMPTTGRADGQFATLLNDFESGTGGAEPVTTLNSHASADSNSVITQEIESADSRLKITDPDGGTNGVSITIPGGIPAAGYYLFTADVKVDNTSAPLDSFGIGVRADGAANAKVSDVNAGYVMNLTGSGDATLGYQTIGAALNVANTGVFPRDVTIYLSTDVSGNDYNAPSTDGDFSGMHRSGAATWPAGSANAVYVDNIKRHGPGNMGEDRHLWISVGDRFTDLAKLESLLVGAKANNFSAVDILARYRADAYYVPNRTDATYPNPEPFGTRVGTHNASPENDPLQYAIDRGHELGLKVYISFSSFLVSTNSIYPSTLPADSVMGIMASGESSPRDMVAAEGEGLWADLGRQDVRDYTKNILMDIVANYDIDGVVFDRARYPGSRFGYNPQALADLGFSGSVPSPFSSAFTTARRDVITDFIGECYEAITTEKPWVVVGATPIAFGNSLADTYRNVFQYLPMWTGRQTDNRTVSFGCIDLLQPQFYRLTTSGGSFAAPEANTMLMNKALFGDLAVDSMDFGLSPGAYTMVAPLLYHPSDDDPAQSNANAQNITDGRALANSGFGLFAATTTLADVDLIRNPAASSAGTDVLAGTPTKIDYLFKAGYDTIAPNSVVSFAATPQARGSVIFNWDDPAPAADGESAATYVIYKSQTQPVREVWANQVTKLPVDGNFFNAPVGNAGSFYYRIVPIDDYNNRGAATEIGPFTVGGTPEIPADIIVDNNDADRTGTWTRGSFSSDKYGANYDFHSAGTGSNTVTFTATIPVSGDWTVSEWHPQGGNRAPDARHVIQHDGGSATVLANQKINGGQWNELGTYSFTEDGNYTVVIDDVFTNTGDTVVMADAIRFSYVPVTAGTPAQPTDLAATVAGTSQINLSWNDNASNETGYELERTIVGGTTVLIQLPANTGSYSDTSLAVDTEYRYVVRAYNSGAQSADSNVVCARTLPQLPDDIIIDDTDADFVGPWSPSSNSQDYGSGYHLTYRGTGDGSRTATFRFTPERDAVYDVYEWHVASTSRAPDAPHIVTHAAGTSTEIVNQTLNGKQWNKIGSYIFNAGVEYSVVINNTHSGGVLEADAIKVAYAEEPPTAPSAPSNLGAIAISQSEIALSWSDNAVNESGFEIERTVGSVTEIIAALGADEISYIDTGLDALTEYAYTVRAVNSQGSSSFSNVAIATTLSSTPADQIIDNTDADMIGNWAFNDSAAERYGVNYAFRGKTPNGANRAVFSFNTPETGLYEIYEWHADGDNRPSDAPHIVQHRGGADTVLVNQKVNGGQWNSIGIFAFNAGGSPSVTITDQFLNGVVVMADAIKVVYIGDAPAELPSAPSDLMATAHGASQIDLVWTDNTDNESGFEILRNGSVLTSVGPNVTSYDDTAAAQCSPYTYTVRSIVYGDRSASSNAASLSLDSGNPEVTAPGAVVIGTDSGSAFATAVSLGSATASDNCDDAPTITNNAPASFPVGVTTVIWTATDAHNNVGTANQTVTVEDRENPVITAPAGVTVVAAADGCFASDVQLGSPVTSDNTGVSTVENDAPTTYPVGSTTVTWKAVDAYGNFATATQVVTVQDNPAEAPATVTATAQAWDRVAVTWSDVSNESLYEVRYATALAGPYTVAGSTAADVTTFNIGGLLPNTIYYFVVEARNSCGSADGPSADALTPLFSGAASDPNSSDTWDSVEDENAEGGSYFLRARRSTDNAAVWDLSVPVDGNYRISVFIPGVDHLSTQANYTVANGGTEETTVINQRKNSGTWVVLGEYQFTTGAVAVNVFQPNNSQNPVIVDGLKIEQLN